MLTYAPESGSQATLKRIKKNIDPGKMLRSMRESVRCGMVIKANIVIGFPGQKIKEVLETFIYIVRMAFIGVHDVAIFPFVPYPGSELYAFLVSAGKIDRTKDLFENFLMMNVYNDIKRMKSWSDEISDRQLWFMSILGMAFFYLLQHLFRPWRGVVAVVRIIRSEPFTMIERTLDGIIRNFMKGRKLRV